MPRFVTLLRGVNVGGAKRVPMADFRALLEALGFSEVETLLNSGNAVFTSSGRSAAAHASRIQAAISTRLQLDVPVIVKSATEFAAIVGANSLAAADVSAEHSRLVVAFTADVKALRSLASLAALVDSPEQLLLGEDAMYLWCANGILESRATAVLLGKSGRGATTRNWATVLKIATALNRNAGEHVTKSPTRA